jgi:lipid A 3-O-deacylase
MKIFRNANVLEDFVRFSTRTSVGILSFAIIGGLLIVWLISDPLFKLGDRFNRTRKQKGDMQRLKVRFGNKGTGQRACQGTFLVSLFLVLRIASAQPLTSPTNLVSDAILALKPSNTNIWQNGIGEGFRPGTQSINLSTGAGYGVRIFGSKESHDLALAGISYGDMFGSVKGEGHWYQGNWELRGELFSGAQFSPTDDWLVGLTPHLRYNFATGTRWIPYVDAGAGVSATSIGPPDLSHYFEFNLQAAVGMRWFIRDNVALGIEARYLHMSCAGMNTPNLGLNNVNGMLSVSWFF